MNSAEKWCHSGSAGVWGAVWQVSESINQEVTVSNKFLDITCFKMTFVDGHTHFTSDSCVWRLERQRTATLQTDMDDRIDVTVVGGVDENLVEPSVQCRCTSKSQRSAGKVTSKRQAGKVYHICWEMLSLFCAWPGCRIEPIVNKKPSCR